jgi:hypothetical protein
MLINFYATGELLDMNVKPEVGKNQKIERGLVD